MNIKDINTIKSIKTPAYVIDERALERNLGLLGDIQKRTGAKILLALKGFSMFYEFGLIGRYLAGVSASSLNEALLGRRYMDLEVHIYAPAYKEGEMKDISSICDHIIFNSAGQIRKFKDLVHRENPDAQLGIRVNPEYSEVTTRLYDPCAENSRLGAREASIDPETIKEMEGLHFHTMCEQDSDTLQRTLKVVEKRFGKYLHDMKWINFGGGHHITREDYDVELLISEIKRIRNKYDIDVYLEPGEAVALNTGYLVASVLDIVDNEIDTAILDASAACHMPDVLEMPYRPHILGASLPEEGKHVYRLGGNTCLAGDIIGDYGFENELREGDKLIFTDMAHYTMVKNNTFNGIGLPSIAVLNESGIKLIKEFGFDDYESRLS